MKCNLCNENALEEILNFQNKDVHNLLYRCKNCGIVSVYPKINNNINFDNSNNCKANTNLLLNHIRYYLVYRWILHFCHKKVNILDFGCGKGEFVLYLRRKGWQAYGTDPIIQVDDIIQSSSYKSFLFPSSTYLAKNCKSKFNAVILNFSLEHCNNPLLILRKLHTFLTPEGLIFIRVPNFSYILKNKKFSSFQLKIPLHCYFFTPESITRLLEKSGFRIVAIDTRFCITSALTPPCSIFPKLDPINWLYEKKLVIKFLKGLILSILCLFFLPHALLKSYMGSGAIIHAVAKIHKQ